MKIKTLNKDKFPSPYGVSFILILIYVDKNTSSTVDKFPSPYGVSFILIINIFSC